MTLQELTKQLVVGNYHDHKWLGDMARIARTCPVKYKVFKRSMFLQTYNHQYNDPKLRHQQGLQWWMTVVWALGWKNVTVGDMAPLLDEWGNLCLMEDELLELAFDKAMEYGETHLMGVEDVDAQDAIDKDSANM